MADGVQTEGVDYTSGVNIAQLAAAGKVFACRYGGPGGDWKHITPAEAQALSAAGVAIVANAEGSAGGLIGGWSTGVSWASLAEEHFRRCGMPAGRPIYFSVDFDVSSTQWAAVASALRGCAEVLGGVHRVGIYGGRRAIEWARRDGVAAWYWQTYGWSGGVWVPGNHIEQYRNGVALAGADVDLDRALTADFGQWTTTNGDDMALDDMFTRQDGHKQTVQQGLIDAIDVIVASAYGDGSHPRTLTSRLNRLEAKVDALVHPAPAPVDIAALVAALRPELEAAAERAVRRVLGKLDEVG